MAKIHPTAIVDPAAELAKSVTVGPYSIIAGKVVVGPDTAIGPHVVIKEYTTIGARCRIFQFAALGEIPQDLKFAREVSSLIIGDDNTIREFATMHRGRFATKFSSCRRESCLRTTAFPFASQP